MSLVETPENVILFSQELRGGGHCAEHLCLGGTTRVTKQDSLRWHVFGTPSTTSLGDFPGQMDHYQAPQCVRRSRLAYPAVTTAAKWRCLQCSRVGCSSTVCHERATLNPQLADEIPFGFALNR